MQIADNSEKHRANEKRNYGLNSSAILLELIDKPQIIEIIDILFSITYKKYFGEKGITFFKIYISFLQGLNSQDDLTTVKKRILGLRNEFDLLGLNDYYTNNFRQKNLLDSLSLINSSYVNGKVIDIGADDNCLAHVLVANYCGVSSVLGTDITNNNKSTNTKNINFKVQDNGSTLPAPNDSFDVAICRYSLHHMSKQEQLSIISEITRILKHKGTLIVYENSISHTKTPMIEESLFLHKKIGCLSDENFKILMSALDVFSLGIKDKNQHFPFTYRTVEEWESIFKDSFSIKQILYYGLPMIDLHQAPLAIFVLENTKVI